MSARDKHDNVLSFNAYKKQLEKPSEELFLDDVLVDMSDEDIELFLLSLIDAFKVPGPANDEYGLDETYEFNFEFGYEEEGPSEHPFLDEFERD